MLTFTSSYLAVSVMYVTGLSDSTASFTADSLNSVVYDCVFFSDIWIHLEWAHITRVCMSGEL